MKLLTTIVLGLSLFAFTSCATQKTGHGAHEHHDGAAKKSCEGKDKKSCALHKKKSDCKDKAGSCALKKGEKKACCKKKK